MASICRIMFLPDGHVIQVMHSESRFTVYLENNRGYVIDFKDVFSREESYRVVERMKDSIYYEKARRYH